MSFKTIQSGCSVYGISNVVKQASLRKYFLHSQILITLHVHLTVRIAASWWSILGIAHLILTRFHNSPIFTGKAVSWHYPFVQMAPLFQEAPPSCPGAPRGLIYNPVPPLPPDCDGEWQ